MAVKRKALAPLLLALALTGCGRAPVTQAGGAGAGALGADVPVDLGPRGGGTPATPESTAEAGPERTGGKGVGRHGGRDRGGITGLHLHGGRRRAVAGEADDGDQEGGHAAGGGHHLGPMGRPAAVEAHSSRPPQTRPATMPAAARRRARPVKAAVTSWRSVA